MHFGFSFGFPTFGHSSYACYCRGPRPIYVRTYCARCCCRPRVSVGVHVPPPYIPPPIIPPVQVVVNRQPTVYQPSSTTTTTTILLNKNHFKQNYMKKSYKQ
ncbi:hypothetical protein BLOT_015168 [Blomia tropicalis]|nr:hypothetical protein BLOT_015168 [Blomia tropicalis]